MKSYPLDKYKFYNYVDAGRPTVVAVSTYAGKTVRAKAKCHDSDPYSEEKGKQLAAARCNHKIAMKRTKRAERKMKEALIQLDAAEAYYRRMREYFNDSATAEAFAQNEVRCLESEM